MFDTLSERLRKTLDGLTGRGRISEADVDAAMREIRLSLLEADVNFKVVKDFVARVRERAVGADVLESLTAGQQVVKIVHDELVELLSAGDRVFHLTGNPAVVAMVGLQGSGKTTSTAKLARHVIKQGRRPLLVAADPYRPAAADQLETLGRQLDIPVYRAPVGTAVVDIARDGVEAAKRQVRDVVILDTAGRLTVDEALMAEIAAVNEAVKPVETLLVVDAMTGQEAVAVAQAFVAVVPVTGPDPDQDRRRRPWRRRALDQRGDRRAGEVHGHRREDGRARGLPPRPPRRPDPRHGRRPHPRRARPGARRSGTGREDGGEASQGQFTLEDFLDQLQQVQKMGPLGQIMSMIPGMGGMAKEAQAAVDRGDLKRVEAIIRSMTPAERRDPHILNGSRRRRIATRLRDHTHRREPAHQAVRRDAEAHEAVRGGRRSSRRPRRSARTALTTEGATR